MSSAANLVAVIPAAGVGSRMQSDCPKQYLTIDNQPVLWHSVCRLLAHPLVSQAVVAVSSVDPYIADIQWPEGKPVHIVEGGKERADSVLAGIRYATSQCQADWVLVHDAARPCLRPADLNNLIDSLLAADQGGILAVPVRDTMKRAGINRVISETVDRNALWHAQTPQLFPAQALEQALTQALAAGANITDEASALEWLGEQPLLVEGHADNIKITHPEDLALARFYLSQDVIQELA
ncbi:2-C-methyl-D-erythritol 4-phosphate cytidylyltransferase [Neiella marina]|uniref:2-C-methyl-D-erythritol 4-phosphate cytidylyltransferase n=1 Tax=Neiella holothuriorum TaxID=2870530 RepID=A0ABS7ECZ0_9GAMM|nr:2-C-methyl-D-erythritol 4-phosphate cytidylyltransferase [Neiella holothuriorum]MBW8189592.1 2-C-methyl-D-erythritol 4-phosphate cytidylyltransferase [Neiella holothuriorum]